ncbi:hypothetical protein E3O10_00130 [Cryobacterium luteum]|uniref:Uncharacterized protein n=1 Tax=Cryobacterium luteum TaxID=1424661 RepID=A0A5F0DHL5_9MICO|nr:hypothetical protein E3O10_00130 [Cryobacterium luteum]
MFEFILAATARSCCFLRRLMPTNIVTDAINTRRGLKWGVPARGGAVGVEPPLPFQGLRAQQVGCEADARPRQPGSPAVSGVIAPVAEATRARSTWSRSLCSTVPCSAVRVVAMISADSRPSSPLPSASAITGYRAATGSPIGVRSTVLSPSFRCRLASRPLMPASWAMNSTRVRHPLQKASDPFPRSVSARTPMSVVERSLAPSSLRRRPSSAASTAMASASSKYPKVTVKRRRQKGAGLSDRLNPGTLRHGTGCGGRGGEGHGGGASFTHNSTAHHP